MSRKWQNHIYLMNINEISVEGTLFLGSQRKAESKLKAFDINIESDTKRKWKWMGTIWKSNIKIKTGLWVGSDRTTSISWILMKFQWREHCFWDPRGKQNQSWKHLTSTLSLTQRGNENGWEPYENQTLKSKLVYE